MHSMQIVTIITVLIFHGTSSVRLHTIFQFIDGFKSEHNLKGYLHVGNDYSVFLRAPKPHDKFLIYELYDAKYVPNKENYKPQLLAITEVPIEYIKQQLKTFAAELFKAKYVDDNVVPGTQVKTLREWQIDQALGHQDGPKMLSKIPIARTVLNN